MMTVNGESGTVKNEKRLGRDELFDLFQELTQGQYEECLSIAGEFVRLNRAYEKTKDDNRG